MKIQSVQWNKLSESDRKEILRRPVSRNEESLSASVKSILNEVKSKGDAAVLELTERHDKVKLSEIKVTYDEIKAARAEVDSELMHALETAVAHLSTFHEAQYPNSIDLETSPGIRCERRFFPINRVGLYVPGGSAPLPSTVMMLGVPSKIAGCELRVLATPPRADGTVNPVILTAAHLLGISEIYKVGGAQAIAALAYGTESIPKVDKIFGPGNSWVTEAKLQVSQDPFGAACDLPAGPSEVMVIADDTADAAFVASDLLSQAEHGSDSQVVLISSSEELIENVLVELASQLQELPRQEIATQALAKSVLISVDDLDDAISICNEYAPEHLILQVKNPRAYATEVTNAGSVFLGPWTPESMGDYASGTNHVLPTYGFARAYSGLSTESFMKAITFQELTQAAFQKLGPVVEVLAEAEELVAHRNAVTLRLNKLNRGIKK